MLNIGIFWLPNVGIVISPKNPLSLEPYALDLAYVTFFQQSCHDVRQEHRRLSFLCV